MKYWPYVLILTLSSCSFIDGYTDTWLSQEANNDLASVETDIDNQDVWDIKVSNPKSATISKPRSASLSNYKRASLARPKKQYDKQLLIYWKIPNTEVSGYLVRWGHLANEIKQELEIPIEKIDIVSDEIQGKLYRIDLVKFAPEALDHREKNAAIFYQLQAVSGEFYSESSPIAKARLSSKTSKN